MINPFNIPMVSSTVSSDTTTGCRPLCNAGSFVVYFWYTVVAPALNLCSASRGLEQEPAPTS